MEKVAIPLRQRIRRHSYSLHRPDWRGMASVSSICEPESSILDSFVCIIHEPGSSISESDSSICLVKSGK